MNPNSLSIEDALLLSAMRCGLTPERPCVHRLQLFFCANFIVGKDNCEEDFQRYIETEADRQDGNNCWRKAGRGLYELTERGYQEATRRFPTVSPRLLPAGAISQVNYSLRGHYGGRRMTLERQGHRFEVMIDGRPYDAQGACDLLGFNTEGRSAPRILYNLAVKNHFTVDQ